MNAANSIERSDIQQTILRTVAYFASFSYPLTVFEIWKWQKEPTRVFSFFEIQDALADLSWANGRIQQSGAFYGWVDERTGSVEHQVEERQRRYVHAFQKERRLRWVLKWMRHIPFIEGIAVCNTLALHAAQERSDIDLFILTSAGRVWSARFWTVLPLRLFRLRPGEAKRDPVDTNFFVSRDAFDLSPLFLSHEDPYFLYWLATLSPVLDRGDVFTSFQKENTHALSVLPAVSSIVRASHARIRSGKGVRSGYGLFSESCVRHFQEWMFPTDTRALLQKNTCVIANAAVLKFHKNDRREEVKAAYLRRLSHV